MSAHFNTPTDEMLLLAETLGEVKTKTEKLEAEFSTQARPLEAATNALSAALAGIKALQFHVLDNNLGALSARVEEMRKAVDEQVGVIALELKKADETNAAKAGQDAEALRAEIAGLQAQLGTLGSQFTAQLARVEFAAKEEAKALQLIPGPAGATGASLNPRGTFIDGETYNRLDVVSWLGSSYIAAVDGVTEKPSKNSNQWQVLASRGGGAAGGAGDFGSLAGVAQINQGGTGQTTRALALNALLPDQAGSTQYMLLTDGSGTVSWGAQPVAGLPSQTSNSGKLLTTDGTNASWSGALSVSGSNANVAGTLVVNPLHTAGQKLEVQLSHAVSTQNYLRVSSNSGSTNTYGAEYGYGLTSGGTPELRINRVHAGTSTNVFTIPTSTGNVTISTTTDSTTKDDGCLVLEGGMGVEKNVSVGGGISIAGKASDPLPLGTSGIWTLSGSGLRINSAGYTFASLTGTSASTAAFTINGTTASTSTSSGALVVSGGVGVAGAIYGGGNLFVSGTGKIGATTAADSRFHVYESSSVDIGNGVTIEQAGTGDAVTAFLLSGVQRWSVGIDNSDSDKFKIGTGALGSADRLTIDTSGNTTIAGTLQVGNAYVAGAPTATGYIVIKDSTGTSYKIPAVAL